MNNKIIKKSITLSQLDKKLKWTNAEKAEIETRTEYLEMLQDLRNLKEIKNITNQDIANQTGISRPQISNILNGKRNATIETISRIAALFEKKIRIKLV